MAGGEAEHDGQEEIFGGSARESGRRGVDRVRPALERPMVWVALAFVAGLTTGRWVNAPAWVLAAGIIFLISITIANLIRARALNEGSREGASRFPSGMPLLVAIGLAGWAESNAVVRTDARAKEFAGKFERFLLVRAEGRVAEFPVPRHGAAMSIVIEKPILASGPMADQVVSFPAKIQLTVGGTPAPVPIPGQRLVAWGRLLPPKPRAFPGDFDLGAYLAGRGIGATLMVSSPRDVEISPNQQSVRIAFYRSVLGVRNWMRANLRASLSPHQADMAMALLLGERSHISSGQYQAYARTGLLHVLSVSGLHTGFLLILLLFTTRALALGPRTCAIIGATGLLMYATLTGFLPPVVRAAVMGCFLMVAWAIGRTSSIPAALASSAFVTLAFDPRNLLRADWQLSYCCVLSITLLTPVIYELIPRGNAAVPDPDDPDDPPRASTTWLRRAARKWLWLPFSVVLAVQMGLLPLQTAMFQQVSLISFVIQPIGVGLSSFIVIGSLIASLLGSVPGLGSAVGIVLGAGIDTFETIVTTASSFRFASISVAPFPVGVVAAYCMVMILGPHLRRGRPPLLDVTREQKRHMIARIGIFLLLLIWAPILDSPSRKALLELYALDVGQGDSLVIKFPNGRAAVIDGGKQPTRSGKANVAQFLSSQGITRIDFVLATHADADHIGGLVPLLESFEIGALICGPDRAESSEFARMQEIVKAKDIPVIRVWAGEKLKGFGGAEIEVLNPFPGQDNNDASVALLIDYDAIEILLTGDIEKPAEDRILKHGLARDIEVLKVAHHGSASSTSEAFLDAFKPEIALISVGRGNPYGHPAPLVLDRLSQHGITVARTDILRTLRVRTDGKRLAVERFDSGRE